MKELLCAETQCAGNITRSDNTSGGSGRQFNNRLESFPLCACQKSTAKFDAYS